MCGYTSVLPGTSLKDTQCLFIHHTVQFHRCILYKGTSIIYNWSLKQNSPVFQDFRTLDSHLQRFFSIYLLLIINSEERVAVFIEYKQFRSYTVNELCTLHSNLSNDDVVTFGADLRHQVFRHGGQRLRPRATISLSSKYITNFTFTY